MNHKIFEYDPSLRPFEKDFDLRMQRYRQKKKELVKGGKLTDFANGSQYFGFHKTENGWYFIYVEENAGNYRNYLVGIDMMLDEYNVWHAEVTANATATEVEDGMKRVHTELFTPSSSNGVSTYVS